MLLWINGAQLPSNLLIRSKGGGGRRGGVRHEIGKKGRDGEVWRGMKKRRGGVTGCGVESGGKERCASTEELGGGGFGWGWGVGGAEARPIRLLCVATVRGGLNRNEAVGGTPEC